MVTPLMSTLTNVATATLSDATRHIVANTAAYNDSATLLDNSTTVFLPMFITKSLIPSPFIRDSLTSKPGPSTANYTTVSITTASTKTITTTEVTSSTIITTLNASTQTSLSTTDIASTSVSSSSTTSSVVVDPPGESYHILAIFVTALFIATILLIIKIISSHNNKRRIVMSWWQPSSSSSYRRSGPAAVYTAASDPRRQVSSMDIPDSRFDWERQFFDEDTYAQSREFDADLCAEGRADGKDRNVADEIRKMFGVDALLVFC